MKLLEQTFENIAIEQLVPTHDEPQHLCLDAGYDYATVRETIDT
jgi:hypothetical protein